MFKNYIRELIKNLPKRETPYQLDLVLEGGAFNGSYVVGILMFLKEMENAKLINIHRISGCSVGALLCLKYLMNDLESCMEEYRELRKCFKKHLNFANVKEMIERNVTKMNEEQFNKIFM